MLTGLKTVVQKSQAFAQEHGMSDAQFLDERLAPDMFPFKKQVQVATDNAKGCAARLSGSEVPSYADDEETFDALLARIEKTITYMQGFTESSFDHAAEVKVTLPYFPGKYMPGVAYALEYAVPNFFFHVTTTYAIARKLGVNIGKADYMNSLPLLDLEA